MKYVRVYEGDYVEDEYVTTYKDHCERVAMIQDNGFDFEGCIVKQADTIEELCDEFYIDYGQERFPYSTYRQYERYAGWGDLIRYLREIHFTGYDGVYGYIWVILPNNAPILKPVIKMKGILPNGKIDWEIL